VSDRPNRPSFPVMVYDGNCGFCYYWIQIWRGITGGQISYRTYQDLGDSFPEIPTENFEASVHFFESEQVVYTGAAAVFKSLSYVSGYRWMWGLYKRLPLVAPVTEWAYRRVAAHRILFSKLTNFFYGKQAGPSTFFLVRSVLLRGVGLIYVLAFLSLIPQITGLIGENGLLSASLYLDKIHSHFGWMAFFKNPTIFWLSSIDPVLILGLIAETDPLGAAHSETSARNSTV